MDEAEYIPALLTGFIGLLGVILGGLIQLVALRRKSIEEQIHELRRECSALATTATNYSATMAQFVRELHGYVERVSEAGPATSEELDEVNIETVEEVSKVMFSEFDKTFSTSLKLTAAKDHRIADQATKIRLKVVDVHNEVAPMLTHESWVTPQRGEVLRKSVETEAEILLGMVTPRCHESFSRFRRRNTVIRKHERQAKKEKKS